MFSKDVNKETLHTKAFYVMKKSKTLIEQFFFQDLNRNNSETTTPGRFFFILMYVQLLHFV
jgi:hypothetical protein